MAFVETNGGASIYYELHAADTRRGPTAIFSCAYCTTRENWRGQIEPIRAAGHSVVIYDLRGHGRSTAPDEDAAYSMELVIGDLLAVAEATTPDAPFVAAGLSFGGLASLHFTKTHSQRVAGLALLGSGPGFKNLEAAAGWAAQVERTASYLETRGFDAFLAGKAGVTCVGAQPELPAAINAASAIREQKVEGVARFGRLVSGPAPSVIDDLAEMQIPALVLVGENDKAFIRAADVMAAKLPQSTHVVVPGAGHIVNIEAEAECNAALLEFLAGLR